MSSNWYIRQNLSIDITTGIYYDSASNTLRVPYGKTPKEALTGCKLKGSVALVDTSGGYYQEYESYSVNQDIDGNWNSDNKVNVKATAELQSGTWGKQMTYRAALEFQCEYPFVDGFDSDSYSSGTAIAYEKVPTDIDFADKWKDLFYGQTNSISSSLILTYDGGIPQKLVNADTYLSEHNAVISCGNETPVSYPNNFTMLGSTFLKNEPIELTYTLDGGITFKQYLAVSYFSRIVAYASPLEIGSQDNPIFVYGSGVTLSKSTFMVQAYYEHNSITYDYFTHNTSIVDATEDSTWSKDTFSVNEVVALGGNPYNITITFAYNVDFEQTLTALLTTYLDVKRISNLILNGADLVPHYYTGEDSYFVTPNFTLSSGYPKLFTIVYNDGTTRNVETSEIVSTEYKLHADEAESPLVAGTSIIGAGTLQLYFKLTLSNGESGYGVFNIYRKADTVVSLSISGNANFEFVLGNKLSVYLGNSLKFIAVWENPLRANDTNYTENLTFDYSGEVMSNSVLGSTIDVHIGSTAYTGISISAMTYKYPAVDFVSIANGQGIRPAYQNNLDIIDLTDAVMEVHYVDSSHIDTLNFATNGVAAAGSTFAVSVIDTNTSAVIYRSVEEINYLNGTNSLNFLNTEAIYNCAFQISVKNIFTTNTSVEKSIPFVVMTLTTLTGIKILQAHTEYKVGEKFLNDNDDTKIRLFYDVTENGVTYTQSTDIYLRDDIPTISVNYAKGTEWTQVDSSKRIIISSVFNAAVSAEYAITVSYDGYVSGIKTNNLVVVWQENITLPDGSIYTEELGVLGIYAEEDTYVVNGIRYLTGSPSPKGYISNIFDTRMLEAQAIMILFDDYNPPVEGSANITITYPSYAGLADNINKCTFGILFGNNNANNRLFISGNPDIANADWHSAETNAVHTEGEVQKANGDFSYFPAENIMYYGETDNKVIGYDIVSNDKLLVLKDKSDKEKTVYFRTPTLVTSLDAAGNAVKDIQGNNLYQEEFSLVKGNNSVAGINPHAIANLNGDTLFIDNDNTVQGLDLTGIIGDNQRYANTRSGYIDHFLKDLDLSESFLWTNNKYLFLPIKDKGLFVTHIDAKDVENNQYEWWLLQSENPTCFIEIDNVVYFGNENGDFYQMRNGEYRDEYKAFVSEGDGIVSISEDNEKITISQAIYNKLFPEDRPYYDESGKQIRELYFRSINIANDYKGSLFQQIGSVINEENDDIGETENIDLLIRKINNVYYLEVYGKVNGVISNERKQKLIKLLKENQDYYLNYYKQGGSQEVICNISSAFYRNYNNKFRLVFVGDGEEEERFLMKIWNNTTKEWDDINLQDLYKANLVQMLVGDYEMVNVDSENYSFQLNDETGELMNIVYYADQPTVIPFYGEIIERRNVAAYYITAPFTMGTLNYFKTIWQITLTNDTGKPSEYDLAIASNKIPTFDTKKIASISKAMIGTNFLDFTFNAVDFDKDVVPRTYTIQRTLGRQKFICFALKNDNNSNAILSSLSVIYTIPFPSYGND